MGYRYYTSVTFPRGAMEIPEVAAWMNDLTNRRWYESSNWDVGDLLVQIAADEVSYGQIPIVDVLDQHDVPYNHYHQQTDVSASDPNYTVYARGAGKDRTKAAIEKGEEEQGQVAKELLGLLRSGQLTEVTTRLEELAGYLPPDMPEDWRPGGSWGSANRHTFVDVIRGRD